MATKMTRSQARPAKDEWGVYDPQQAGLAALFARLDSKDPKASAATPTKVEPNVDALPPLPRPTLRDAT
jgi:hypothetical protein